MSASVAVKDLMNATGLTTRKALNRLQGSKFALAVNANGTQTDVSDHDGEISAVTLCNSAIGSGMTIDVLVNGASVLAGGTPFTHSASYPANTEVVIPVAKGKTVRPGDTVAVTRGSFTAGASVVRVDY